MRVSGFQLFESLDARSVPKLFYVLGAPPSVLTLAAYSAACCSANGQSPRCSRGLPALDHVKNSGFGAYANIKYSFLL